MAVDPNTTAKFQGIKRFVVRMLENRSFDHLFGYLKATNSKEKLIPVICQFKPKNSTNVGSSLVCVT